jgi:hypothetical protein
MRLYLISLVFVSLSSFAQLPYTYVDKHNDDINCISFSPDNNYIVSGGWDGKLIAYKNDSTYQVEADLKEFVGAVNSIAFSRDGYNMIAGGQEGKLAIYHFNDYKSFDVIGLDTALEINRAQINKLIYGPGMRTIFSAGDNGKFMTYDLTKKKVIPLETKRPISAAAVSIDRRSYFIANEGDPTIKEYNVFGKEIKSFVGHTNDVTDLITTPNRKYLISSSKDRTVRIWNILTGKVERTLNNHTWFVTDMDADPYGKYLVTCGLDGKVNLYEVETGELLKEETLPKNRCNAIAISPDLTKIAVATHMSNQTDKSGFFVIPSDLPPRKVKTAKRFIADKKERAYYEAHVKEQEQEDEPKNEKGKPTINAKGPNTPAKKVVPSEKVLEKTEQVEIRRDE